MRNSTGFLSFASLIAALAHPVSARGQASVAEPAPIEAGQAAPAGRYDGAVDVLDYDVEIRLPEAGGSRIEGRATLRLRPGRSGVAEAVLDFTGLAVVSLTVDGQAVTPRLGEGLLHVPLPAGSTTADTLRMEVRYEGTPDDGLILRPNVHGRPSAFVDNWPNRTRFWLPSVDHPSDKATASITVHAPASWVIVANGRQVGEPSTVSDGMRIWRWRTDERLSTYNLVFGGAEMAVIPLGPAACGRAPASPRPDGCIEVSAWLFREDTAQARSSFGRAAQMVDFYTDLVGPYPFEKLAHVQSATRFGGMENASAIFYSEEDLASGRSIEGTVAHETAHQWFGDSVTEADWPELWLSEGFATYFGNLFFESADGVADFRERMDEARRSYLGSDVTGQPIISPSADLFALLNANNYPKGGWVLHMVRGLVGDEAFFSGIRTFYDRHKSGLATTRDLEGALSAAAGGRDLRWFFRQWTELPGYPLLAVEQVWDSTAREVTVTVRQQQDAAWPTFRLPMEVEVVGAGQATRHRVEVTDREHTFRFAAQSQPDAVRLDPDGWVLKRLVGEGGR